MRIYYITAGAAGMYCGSCIRDNALAAELIRQGHQVLLVPLYTPIRTDEEDVSERKIFFGGISVFLEQHSALFRRTRFLDWLWDSPRLLQAIARLSITTDPKLLGEITVSVLRGEDGYQRREFQKLLGWFATQPRPDVVSLHSTLLIALARPLKRALGCAVCCTMQGEDHFLGELREPYRSQALELIRACVPDVDAFVAVSEFYAQHMSRYLSLPQEKVAVVPMGVNLTGYPPAPRTGSSGGPFTVGYFARVTPEKNLERLCEAYRTLRERYGLPPSRLAVAGYLAREHEPYLRQAEQRMRAWGLGDEFRYHGVLDRTGKIHFLKSLDVLSVPGSYAEPKGMYALEAMACGVPVVQPRRGVFPELIARTGGGLLFEPDNTESLAQSLAALWRDSQLAAELGRNGFNGVRQHYSAAKMAARALQVYQRVGAHALVAEGRAVLRAGWPVPADT